MAVLDTGVYCIKNKVNGKQYIGSACKSFTKRFYGHKTALRHQRHHSRHLQGAWDRYGEDKFEFLVIERCKPKACTKREQFWINLYRTADSRYGYNVSPTAGSPLGVRHTNEARENMSRASRGKKKSPQHAANISAAKKKMTDETKEKMSTYAKNRSPEHQEKLRKAAQDRDYSKMVGRTHSESTKQKIAERTKETWRLWKETGHIKHIVERIKIGQIAAKKEKVS